MRAIEHWSSARQTPAGPWNLVCIGEITRNAIDRKSTHEGEAVDAEVVGRVEDGDTSEDTVDVTEDAGDDMDKSEVSTEVVASGAGVVEEGASEVATVGVDGEAPEDVRVVIAEEAVAEGSGGEVWAVVRDKPSKKEAE